MNTGLGLLSLVVVPSSGNSGDDVTKWKAALRTIIADESNIRLVSTDASSKNNLLFRLFDTKESDTEEDGLKADEVDEFFNFTRRADKSCKNLISWMRHVGLHRFHYISRTA